MFLDLLRRRNPRLIEQAIALHQTGKIPANTFVIDLDAVEANAHLLADAGSRHGVAVLAMTKQMGRNASFCRALLEGGIGKAVAVDMECARACARAGLSIGHLGHLVQIPTAEADAAAALFPDYWTVFNEEKARQAGHAAQKLGRTQNLLARIVADGDTFYRGHEGGFPADRMVEVANSLDRIEGARFAGITTFPALLFDHAKGTVGTTPNLKTLVAAAGVLGAAGRRDIVINTPGTTSSEVMHLLADAGATQVEPGHGLTGTTPLHAVRDLPELPAVAYISEVSHTHGHEAYCFGGGLYIDPVFPNYPLHAVVAREPCMADGALLPVEIPSPAAIDYYGMIDGSSRMPRVGDSVVFGFRPQVFVTRAYTAGLAGLAMGKPVVETIYDAFGRPVDWPA